MNRLRVLIASFLLCFVGNSLSYAVQLPDPHNCTILALDRALCETDCLVHGNVCAVSNSGSVQIWENGVVTGSVVAKSLNIATTATVWNIFTNINGLSNVFGTVNGEIHTDVTFPFSPWPLDFPATILPGDKSFNATKRKPLTLLPGAYRNINVTNGGVLNLGDPLLTSPAVYQFRSLLPKSKGTIRIQGPVQINVERFKTGKKTTIELAPGICLRPDQVVFSIGWDGNVGIGGENRLFGNYLAQNSPSFNVLGQSIIYTQQISAINVNLQPGIGGTFVLGGYVCGDGVLALPINPACSFEDCDDGNTVSGDGCSSTCTLETPIPTPTRTPTPTPSPTPTPPPTPTPTKTPTPTPPPTPTPTPVPTATPSPTPTPTKTPPPTSTPTPTPTPTKICWECTTFPEVNAVTEWHTNPDGTTTVRATLSRNFVDNTYGVNVVGWPGQHKFSQLTGSDQLQMALYDTGGTKRMEFKIDYLTADSSAPSGYKTKGVTGGDGGMLVGSASDVVAALTSLDVNFNTYGYVLTVDSPKTDASYTANPTYPNWIWDVWYEATVKPGPFASGGGFGRPSITGLHASPSKVGSNTCPVVQVSCP